MFRRRNTYDETAPAAPGRRAGYDFTRALFTLVGAAGAGFLIWLATLVDIPGAHSDNRWWAAMGLIAGAGLAMALSQLFGGWTKWGWPRLSVPVFVFGFLPVLVCVGWILVTTQPHGGWQQHRLASWSASIGIGALVRHLGVYAPVFAFGFGLVFGYSFDTTGPALRRRGSAVPAAAPAPAPVDRRATDEPLTADRQAEPATTATAQDGTSTATRTRTRTTNRT
jgi:hypothetical protein